MFLLAYMTGSYTCCHRSWHLKCTDRIPAFILHKSLNQSDNVQVYSTFEQITPLCSKVNICIWKPANLPALRKHTYHTFTTVLRLQWGVYWKAVSLRCVTRNICKSSDTLQNYISLSRDELCPEDKLQRWISIIVSLLHSWYESGGPVLKATKSSCICLDKWSSSFKTHMPGYLIDFTFKKKQCSLPLKLDCKLLPQHIIEAGVIWEVMSVLTLFSPFCENSICEKSILNDMNSSWYCCLHARGAQCLILGFW